MRHRQGDLLPTTWVDKLFLFVEATAAASRILHIRHGMSGETRGSVRGATVHLIASHVA
jgi:hypothetical protein